QHLLGHPVNGSFETPRARGRTRVLEVPDAAPSRKVTVSRDQRLPAFRAGAPAIQAQRDVRHKKRAPFAHAEGNRQLSNCGLAHEIGSRAIGRLGGGQARFATDNLISSDPSFAGPAASLLQLKLISAKNDQSMSDFDPKRTSRWNIAHHFVPRITQAAKP